MCLAQDSDFKDSIPFTRTFIEHLLYTSNFNSSISCILLETQPRVGPDTFYTSTNALP